MNDIGKAIRQGRGALRWSQEKLGAQVGVKQPVISRIELGLVGEITTVLDNALSERVQASVKAGHIDVAASEALAAIQAVEPFPLAVAA